MAAGGACDDKTGADGAAVVVAVAAAGTNVAVAGAGAGTGVTAVRGESPVPT